jgi:hypothetical protein
LSFELDTTAAHASYASLGVGSGVSAQSDEAGKFYLVQANFATLDSRYIEALGPSRMASIDAPQTGQQVSFYDVPQFAPQLDDGTYVLMFRDVAGNFAYAKSSAGGAASITVSGQKASYSPTTPDQVGGPAIDFLYAQDSGGTLKGGEGNDTFIWSKGQTGTYSLPDFQAGETLKFTTNPTSEQSVSPSDAYKITWLNGVASLLFDADGRGEFANPEITVELPDAVAGMTLSVAFGYSSTMGHGNYSNYASYQATIPPAGV